MMKSIFERALEAVDIEKIVKDVTANLTVKDLELYFIVQQFPDSDHHNFIGLAYSKDAAGKLWIEATRSGPTKIMKLNFGKAITLAQQAGIITVEAGTEEG